MSIYTNRIKIQFHIDAIQRDFVFLRLQRQQKGTWWGAKELDYLLGNDYEAMSVGYAQYAYAMFEKDSNDIHALRQKLINDANFSKVAAIEVQPEAFYSGNDECICGITLARLLINSLGSSRSRFKYLHFSNLTGTLLKVPMLSDDKLYNALSVAEISLRRIDKQDDEFLLNVTIATYRKKVALLAEYRNASDARKAELKKVLKRPEYVFHSGTSSLRRWLPSNGAEADATQTYIKCGFPDKRRHVNFLEFGKTDDFDRSRAGIFHQVFESIQEHLSKYINVSLSIVECEHTIELSNSILKRPKQLHGKLEGQPIRIVDRVQNEESDKIVKSLRRELEPYLPPDCKLIRCVKNDKAGALNFRVIHDAEYYENIGHKDEYLSSTDAIQRQHITIESTATASDAFIKNLVKTTIKELLVKRDIGAKTLSLFDWSQLKTRKKWTFAAYDEKALQVIFMEIMPDGSFEFRELDATALFEHQEYQRYMDFIHNAKDGERRTGLYFEGLVVSEENDINLIFRTDEITLPELSEIKTILQEKDAGLPEELQSGQTLALIVQNFMSEYSIDDNDKLFSLYNKLFDIGNTEISKNDFRVLLNEQLGKTSKVAAELRDYLLDKYQIRLIFPKHGKSLQDLFAASLNVKYFGETATEASYFVGKRRENVQFSFERAFHIRKIVTVDDSKLVFKQLLPTMDVDFVRTGQSTVLPFPFKYIREYKKFDDD